MTLLLSCLGYLILNRGRLYLVGICRDVRFGELFALKS